jgi:hypothetical protein
LNEKCHVDVAEWPCCPSCHRSKDIRGQNGRFRVHRFGEGRLHPFAVWNRSWARRANRHPLIVGR